MPFDPFDVSASLREAFVRYLRDSHPVHAHAADLARQFEEALRLPERFVREPVVSAIPTYEQDRSLRELINGRPRWLHPALLRATGLDADRPLYRHQVTAIKQIEAGRNVIVATGTGSGKTECFLLPVLAAAARAREDGQDGVIAVLVYPMNALANDQLDRLRELIGNSTDITFGRYTSQTPQTEREFTEDQRRAASLFPNERATRQQIQEQPPQILLTNFAMLEYLLLRPRDQGIFRQPTLRFVVLDEAHSYSGSQGIDIGLLMRRLTHRSATRPKFVLTSATLGGPDDAPQIADFGQRLTGAAFEAGDVIRGYVADPFTEAVQGLTPADLAALATVAPAAVADADGDADATRQLLVSAGLEPARGATSGEVLYHTLCRLAPMATLYRAVVERAHAVGSLADVTFAPDDADRANAESAVRMLLTAASFARPAGPYSGALLSVRLHHFFRGLSGASVLLTPGQGGDVRVAALTLENVREDPATGRRLLPLRTCVHCGMPAVVITVDAATARWRPYVPAPVPIAIQVLTWLSADAFDPPAIDSDDADETTEDRVELCLDCGAYGDNGNAPCDCDGQAKIRLRPIPTSDPLSDALAVCPCCGGQGRPAPTVLRDFRTGEDAPTAVLAEQMLRGMPFDPDREGAPANGRQLLAFSDSRQRAAFFTPYLTRTCAEPAMLQPLLFAARALTAEGGGRGVDAVSVIDRALDDVRRSPWTVMRTTDNDSGFERYDVLATEQLTPAQVRVLRRELAMTLYAQLTSPTSHRSKFGGLLLAAAEIGLTESHYALASAAAPELFSDQAVGRDALQRMLLAMVRRYAVNFEPESITPKAFMSNGGPALVTLHRTGGAVVGRGVSRERVRWNPYEATQRRAYLVRRSVVAETARRAIGAAATDEVVRNMLDALWTWMINPNGGVLRETAYAGEYQLPAGRLNLVVDGPWYRCRRCGSASIHPMDGSCQTGRCPGRLEYVTDEQRERFVHGSHTAGRYTRPPMPVVVREHTAQLTLERGRQYQDEFKRGQVNVLSSSTTFEMGVDVGQLQAVLLRNVPPGPANYIQRAGRAGRRQQGVAHAVTFARTVPHDQHHYFSPDAVINGRVPVPVIYTANTVLTQRHVNSMLLGRFLREATPPAGDEQILVHHFFPTSLGDNRPATLFTAWTKDNVASLETDAAAIIPPDCPLTPAEAVQAAAATLYDADPANTSTVFHRGLRAPTAAFAAQAQELEAELLAAVAAGQHNRLGGLGHAVQRAKNLGDQVGRQHLIDFLSAEHWLPAYAFPQDVVRLTVRQAQVGGVMRLERDRELGISEYSPGGEIIADGKLFESVGVNLERRQPDLQYFRADPVTRRVAIGHAENDVRAATPNATRRPLRFLEPSGFTTQWDAEAAEPNLYRLRPPSSSEVFLRDGAETFQPHPALPAVSFGLKEDATLFRANTGSGEGFRICLSCGRALEVEDVRRQSHPRPYGGICTGRAQPIALAHLFETNVLQLRFPGATGTPGVDDRKFWLTLSTAFAASACRTLSIATNDLDTTYQSTTEAGRTGELILYDRVPGGAGHVRRIADRLPEVLAATLGLLARCENADCGATSSCYACLRSHRNQFDWENLDRSRPLPWITALLR